MELKVSQINIADKTISLELEENLSFWSMWPWKLDPFWIRESSCCTTSDMKISLIKKKYSSNYDLNDLKLLYQEHTGMFFRKVYQLPNGETLWLLTGSNINNPEIILEFIVSANWKEIQLLEDYTQSQGQVAFEYLAQMMPGVLAKEHMLSFHSALVECHGYAFAVCGESGVGKTTHARLWRDYKNAIILNGDRSICKRIDNQWMAYGSPWSGTSGEQINRSAPFKGIVVLKQSSKNTVEQLSGIDAFSALFHHLVYPSWDVDIVNNVMDEFDAFLTDIPVYSLHCKPDQEAVDVLEQALYKEK